MSSSLSGLNFVSSVAERDIDFIVLEELEVSDSFRAWISARVYEVPVFKSRIGAWHSVTQAGLGESDVVILFEATDGSRKSILIENKIDAPPQPDQGERYQKRGEQGIEEGSWDEFRTCIIAPRRYLGSTMHSEIYDAEVSYEEIMAYFVSRGFQDTRFTYRASLIQEGIEQNRRGYKPKISEPMTAFVREYVTFAKEHFPDLCVQDAKPRPAGGTWIQFYPGGMSKDFQIMHQVTAGFVKILIGGMADRLEEYRDKYKDEPIPDLEVVSTGKSISLALSVSEIDPISEVFSASRDRVKAAMDKLTDLVSLAKSRGDI